MTAKLRWDIFCKVIDNFGDVGVCWRLAADLAGRGQTVRLWCDDPSALQWMAPHGAAGVSVRPWSQADADASGDPALPAAPDSSPGDVVIEAFGCDPPESFVRAMAERQPAPVWINLEYLSAEPWVERCHGLPSPQSTGPGAGLTKWFFYPGFTVQTGGLLREPSLLERQVRFHRTSWLAARGLALQPGERLAVLFCYDNPALPSMLRLLAERPTLLALTPGPAQRQVRTLQLPPSVRIHELPWLSQEDFDHLLWSGDLNLVRGEDSLVRAIWAGRPFLWQLYPQSDGAHQIKSAAFLDRLLLAGADQGVVHDPSPGNVTKTASALWFEPFRQLWNHWNGAEAGASTALGRAPGAEPLACLAWPDETVWTRAVLAWRAHLLRQQDLSTQLMAFAASRAPAGSA